ncbi:MAG: hypothetical protein AAB513_01240 [Patescibacteria group bacterium]
MILVSLKAWELHRGAKPFSVLRYRLDILVRRGIENLKSHSRYISWTTARITLAFLVAKIVDLITLIWKKFTSSEIFELIRGKVIPKASGPVSAFLRDVAEFKSAAVQGSEEMKKEFEKEVEKSVEADSKK